MIDWITRNWGYVGPSGGLIVGALLAAWLRYLFDLRLDAEKRRRDRNASEAAKVEADKLSREEEDILLSGLRGQQVNVYRFSVRPNEVTVNGKLYLDEENTRYTAALASLEHRGYLTEEFRKLEKTRYRLTPNGVIRASALNATC